MTSQSSTLPPITTLPHASDDIHKTVLDTLFEPSSTLQALTLPVLRSTPFPSYDILITAIHAQLSALAASDEEQDVKKLAEILSAHPRLGEKKVDSELSRGEQKSLEGEGEELMALNKEYEDKFPGLRYV
jgi:2-oxo-4-hydroxy-4-carboxy--5-ureidoimidazoline (OHCU) decarboxylase